MLAIRIVHLYIQPVLSAAMQPSSKTRTIMCCHHWRQREANIFNVLPWLPVEEPSISDIRFAATNNNNDLKTNALL